MYAYMFEYVTFHTVAFLAYLKNECNVNGSLNLACTRYCFTSKLSCGSQ